MNVKYDGIVSFLRLYTHGWWVGGAKNKSQLDIYGPCQGSWVWVGDELGPKISHPLPHPPTWSQKERIKEGEKEESKILKRWERES